MTDIRYLAAQTLDEAVGAFAAAQGAARVLAGGTDLLVQMRAGTVKPGLIVDIKKIAEMTEIVETADGGFRIGAAVSGAALAEHPGFGKAWPGVLEAINLIGSNQVQGRASPGGNLCNASPAGGQRAGDDRGRRASSRCRARTGGATCRWKPCRPGRAGPTWSRARSSSASPCRRAPPGSADAYLRMIPRTEMDIAVVGRRRQPDACRAAPSPPPASASAPWRRPCCWSRMPPRR